MKFTELEIGDSFEVADYRAPMYMLGPTYTRVEDVHGEAPKLRPVRVMGGRIIEQDTKLWYNAVTNDVTRFPTVWVNSDYEVVKNEDS